MAQNENMRGGWMKKTFSKRQPMSPGVREVDRHHHFSAGVLLSSGLSVPSSPKGRPSPGPGHYIGQPSSFASSPNSVQSQQKLNMTQGSSQRSSSAGSISGTRRGSLLSAGSPRLAANSTILRDGILFISTEGKDSGLGPGYYAPVSSSFTSKSFNTRVTKRRPGSAGASPRAALPSPKGVGSGSPAARLEFMSPSSQSSQVVAAESIGGDSEKYTPYRFEAY